MIQGTDIALAAVLAAPVIAIGLPIARAFARRIEGGATRPAALPAEMGGRLARMEQALDSVALEVERISEAQRFTTKLLAERAGPAGVVAAGSAGRVPS